jgi:hypothetical protein
MSRVNYSKLVPADSFVGRYLQYMSVQETPHAYDFWNAIWSIGVAAGRNCVVDRPRIPVYLNWYIILVAQSGTTRKSTSVVASTKLVREVLDDNTLLVESKMTPEALELSLHEATRKYGFAHAAISISELVTFLGREKYAAAMPGLLTDLYDCAAIKTGGGTISRGPTNIRDVFVSFLSASTPAWLIRAINPDVIEGGFTSRCIFVVAEERKKRVAWPDDSNVADAKGRLIDELRHIREFAATRRRIQLNDTGLKKFTAWYNSRSEHRDPFRSSFESREDSHVLRLAACLSINDGSWDIQGTHITSAIKVINQVKEDGASIFAGGQSNSQLVLGIDKVKQCLIEAGTSGATQTALTKACKNYMNAGRCVTVLEIMHELQMVQRFEGIQLGQGRPATVWRATNQILAKNSMELILNGMEPDR